LGKIKVKEIECCPLCGSRNMRIFYEVIDIPASCNLLWKSKEEAINCTKGNIKLSYCPSCTFVTNSALEREKNKYTSLYDNNLFYSQHFQNFVKETVAELIQKYDLHNKTVIEITCGKVDFLSFFSYLGNNKTIKLSTLSKDGKINAPTSKLDMSADEFKSQKIDFIFSYHELEHVNNPKQFLESLRKGIADNSDVIVFFAVPNSLKAFEEGDYSDIIYEHTSYFTIPSLSYLFSVCGFSVLEISESKGTIFDSIYVIAKVNMAQEPNSPLNRQPKYDIIENSILEFAKKSQKLITLRSQQLTKLLDAGKKIVMWGAGARGVTFLNLFKDTRIKYAVDINPMKQGKFVPGTGQLIVSPDFLRYYTPEIIILANPAYRKEIERTINNLSLSPEFLTI
jgi:hypothetical protein